MGFLSVKELEKKSAEKAKVNHETYKHIYDMCTNEIKRQHGTGNTCTLYTVPSFIIGRTPYTHSHAVRYTVEKLQRGGFRVTQDDDYPGVLLVDWSRRKEKESKKQESKQCKDGEQLQKEPKKKKKRTPSNKTKIQEPLSVRIARLQSRSIMNA